MKEIVKIVGIYERRHQTVRSPTSEKKRRHFSKVSLEAEQDCQVVKKQEAARQSVKIINPKIKGVKIIGLNKSLTIKAKIDRSRP